jgi:hypothetical protein
MKLFNTFFIFFLLSNLSFSQEIPNDYISLQEQFVVLRDSVGSSKIEGSQFFEQEFVKGTILENGKKLLDAYLRYNVVKEQVQIKVDKADTEVFVLPRLQLYAYDFGNYTYLLKNFSTKNGEVLLGYSIIYFQSDTDIFLSKPSVKVTPEKKAETTYGRTRPARYSIRNKYYFGANDQPLEEVKIKEKTFKSLLKDSKRLQHYFDNHKINEVDEVVQLLKFYEGSNLSDTGL